MYPALRIEETMFKIAWTPFLSLVVASALAASPTAARAADEKGELLLAATRKGDLPGVRKLLDSVVEHRQQAGVIA